MIDGNSKINKTYIYIKYYNIKCLCVKFKMNQIKLEWVYKEIKY